MTAATRPAPSVFDRWWFGHVVLLAMSGAIVLAAFVLQPGDDLVTLFGHPIPMTCGFRRVTGYGCPGCGLTRSFVYMAHGQVLAAFRMHPIGPPFFAFMAAQVPWQVYQLWSGLRRRRAA